jgi:hemerythrin-like domain-containing protein
MDSIKLMMEEHQHILRMLKVVRNACYKVMQGEPIKYDDFDLMIDFIRQYADSHHHGKEEKFLFNEMVSNLGPIGNKLITNGMLVEHDFGRLFIRELKEALDRVKDGDDESRLDVIANAISYTHLLKRHIEKEDSVVYTFAKRQLSKDIMDAVEEKTEAFERVAQSQGVQSHYITVLNDLEKIY